MSKISNRFLFLYFSLYMLPHVVLLTTPLFNINDFAFWKAPSIWFGETFIGWELNPENLIESYDSKYEYSRLLLILSVSVICTFIWNLIDLKFNPKYKVKLNTLLKTILRYHVGAMLITYGLAKVFMLQFGNGDLDLQTLENRVGSFSPMALLGVFMGYSKIFTMTAGYVELIGGILLFFRRTTFLGGILATFATLAVSILNMDFKVSLKLLAIHLFLMSFVILKDDFKRLINFFVFNKVEKLTIYLPLFASGKPRKIGLFLKGVILFSLIVFFYTDTTPKIKKSKSNKYDYMTGFHMVRTMIVNNDTIPNLTPHRVRWESMLINANRHFEDVLIIKKMGQRRGRNYTFEVDSINKTLNFYPQFGDENDKYQFHYKKLNQRRYIFKGTHSGDSIYLETRLITSKDYPLTTPRRPNWIIDNHPKLPTQRR